MTGFLQALQALYNLGGGSRGTANNRRRKFGWVQHGPPTPHLKKKPGILFTVGWGPVPCGPKGCRPDPIPPPSPPGVWGDPDLKGDPVQELPLDVLEGLLPLGPARRPMGRTLERK